MWDGVKNASLDLLNQTGIFYVLFLKGVFLISQAIQSFPL